MWRTDQPDFQGLQKDMSAEVSVRGRLHAILDGKDSGWSLRYWVTMGEHDSDDFCLDCCKKEADELKVKNPGEDIIIGGGEITESDRPRSCEACGARLLYSLTEYGVKEELECFLHNDLGEIDPDTAYTLIRLMAGVTDILEYSRDSQLVMKTQADMAVLELKIASVLTGSELVTSNESPSRRPRI